MKRRLECVEEQTGAEASAPQDTKANKKAKPFNWPSEDTKADAHTTILLSELPDLVLHQLVRFVHLPLRFFICSHLMRSFRGMVIF
jgi:exonuclease V gamma subunit